MFPRTLDAFGDLTEAEERLRAGVGGAAPVVLGDGVPESDAGDDRRVRASFIRYLALGGCEACRPGEKGVQLRGALIVGDGDPRAETQGLDLEGCTLKGDLGLLACRFPEMPLLRGAALPNLYLNDSVLEAGLSADRLEAKGGVFLRRVAAKGEVRLLGATLGGNLDCEGAQFTALTDEAGDPGDAFSGDRLEAKGDVVFESVVAKGAVRLLGATLGGDLDCAGARFTALTNRAGNPGHAFAADGLVVRGCVFLRGVVAQGEVRLAGATLGGDLSCTGATFEGCRQDSGRRGRALDVAGADVAGSLFWRAGASAVGPLDLMAASFGSINDDPRCWPAKDLMLNRCRYGAFTGEGVSGRERIDWLSRQDPGRWGKDFWPQPYEQCAKVLREMGHRSDARMVLIEKERLQRQVKRDGIDRELAFWRWRRDRAPRDLGFAPFEDRVIGHWLRLRLHQAWDGILAWTIGYGYRSELAVIWAAGLILFGALIFGMAAGKGAIKPNTPVVLRSAEWVECRDGGTLRNGQATQLACYREQPEARGYPAFNAFIYSADTFLPVVSLEMQGYWIPDERAPGGVFARVYLWVHIAAGWALSLLAVAGFSGLVKSD